jgi:hypothetical protein
MRRRVRSALFVMVIQGRQNGNECEIGRDLAITGEWRNKHKRQLEMGIVSRDERVTASHPGPLPPLRSRY